jgi:hypothetical protein
MSFNIKDSVDKETSVSMGQDLRAVGQGLESLDVQDFDLQAEGVGYLALGMVRPNARDTAKRSEQAGLTGTLKSAWHNLTRRVDDNDTSKAMPQVLRILFTPEGILRLEREGKAKRSEESAGIPNVGKLAQVLRMLGKYLDERSGRLLQARKREDWISFEYETASNGLIREKWKLSQLYELWLKASNLREERYETLAHQLDSKLGTSSDPANR